MDVLDKKRLRITTIGATVALLCVSCAAVTADPPGPTPSDAAAAPSVRVDSRAAELVPSEICSVGMIIDWDGTPGPATAVGAVQEMIEFMERPPEPPESVAVQTPIGDPQHPIRRHVTLRGLRALLDVLIEQWDSGQGQGGLVFAYTETGQELARAIVEKAGPASSGYRVGMFSATGWTSDDPLCAEHPEGH